jgi:cyclase
MGNCRQFARRNRGIFARRGSVEATSWNFEETGATRGHSRRGFLKQALGACWTGGALLEQAIFRAAHARAQSKETTATLFDIEKVGDGVYAALARPQALTNCNAVIFENARDVLVVDTHSKPSAVASLVAQFRRDITTKPIRYIVNTHFHWDHTQGTPAYKRIAPHADVLASTATRRLLFENGAARLKDSLEEARKSLEGYKEELGSAKSESEKSYYQNMARQTAAYLQEMQDYSPELPNVTFDHTLVIHDQAHELHLAFRGRGHTGGDIVVFCPQKKIIATGDLLHGFFPYIGDGYPLEWPRTLYSLAEFEFAHVIGGHGAIQHTRGRLYQMAGYIEELTEAVASGKRAGRSVEELQREITPKTVVSFSRTGYRALIARSLAAFRAHPPGTSVEQMLADGVRTNVGQIFQRLEMS